MVGLNRDRIGHRYPPTVHEVTHASIHAYAKAIGEEDPRHLAAGAECVAPPTYAAAFTIVDALAPMLADPELRAHSRLVHGGQSYEFGERVMRPGDRITSTATITSIEPRLGNEVAVITVDARHDDGRLAVIATSTIVFLPVEVAA